MTCRRRSPRPSIIGLLGGWVYIQPKNLKEEKGGMRVGRISLGDERGTFSFFSLQSSVCFPPFSSKISASLQEVHLLSLSLLRKREREKKLFSTADRLPIQPRRSGERFKKESRDSVDD